MRFVVICKEHHDFQVHFPCTRLEQTEWFQTFLLQVRKLRAEGKRPVSKSKVQSETKPRLCSFQCAFTAYANQCLKTALEVGSSGLMLSLHGQGGTESQRSKVIYPGVQWRELWQDLHMCSFHCTAPPSGLLANGYLSREAKDTSGYF